MIVGKGRQFLAIICAFFALTGCATVENQQDPIMPVNRAIYGFNKFLDTYLLRPIAVGYQTITPAPVDKGITNFFVNLDQPTVIINSLLQAKMGNAGIATTRFVVNSTVGILGFFDVATAGGLVQDKEDFGQTLGVWGIRNPAYLVLPLLGPSTLRDAPALIVDNFTDIKSHIRPIRLRNGLYVLYFIDKRADLLGTDELLAEQVDEYVFVRDAYLQKRRSLIDDKDEGVDVLDEIENEDKDKSSQ